MPDEGWASDRWDHRAEGRRLPAGHWLFLRVLPGHGCLKQLEGGPRREYFFGVTDSQPALGTELAEVTKGMVSLHRRFYGKGPTKAKTHLVDSTVVCVLYGGFTTVERTLIEEHDVETVLQVRRSFQRAMEHHFTEVVEGALGRKVIAYMSQIHADPDLAVELFVLAPHEDGDEIVGEHGETIESHDSGERE
jgi:uncharacterized protein YbcI